jgi:hypothetical protein
MLVEIGQIWTAVDKRYDRTVLVTGFVDGKAVLATLNSSGIPSHKSTLASLSRFNGKSGGYRYGGRKEKLEVRAGQQYKERHSRNLRIVEIVNVTGDYATIIPVRIQAPDGRELGTQHSKPTKAHLNRFSGPNQGYKRIY